MDTKAVRRRGVGLEIRHGVRWNEDLRVKLLLCVSNKGSKEEKHRYPRLSSLEGRVMSFSLGMNRDDQMSPQPS